MISLPLFPPLDDRLHNVNNSITENTLSSLIIESLPTITASTDHHSHSCHLPNLLLHPAHCLQKRA